MAHACPLWLTGAGASSRCLFPRSPHLKLPRSRYRGLWIRPYQYLKLDGRNKISRDAMSGLANQTLPATDPWLILAALTVCGAAAQSLETSTRIGAVLSAPMMSLSMGLAAAAGGILPPSCAVYDAVWEFLMPMAAGLFMLEHDVSRLFGSGGPVLLSFLLGAAGMFAGALLSWQLVGAWMGPHGAQLAACLCASYIGGSVNFAAVAKAVALPAAVIPGAMAADNLAMAGLLAVLLACPLHLLGQKLAAAAVGVDWTAAAAAVAVEAGRTSTTAAAGEEEGGAVGEDQVRNSSSAVLRAQLSVSDLACSAKPSGGLGSSRWGFSGWAGGKGQLALDGQPLLTEDPTSDQVSTCMAAAKAGRKREIDSQRQAHGSNTSSNKGPGREGYGPRALDGQPLCTELPDTSDIFAALQAARRGESSPSSSLDHSPSSSRDGWETGYAASASGGADPRGHGARRGNRASAAAAAAAVAAPARDGQALLTDPPSAAEVAAAIEAARRGDSNSSSSSLCSSSSSRASWDDRESAAAWNTGRSGGGGGGGRDGAGGRASNGTSWQPGAEWRSGRAGVAGLHGELSASGRSIGSSSAVSSSSSNGNVGIVGGTGSDDNGAGRKPAIKGVAGGGPRALDGGPLLTEEPSAAAVASAMQHARSGSSISSVSSLSSADGLEGGVHGLWCPPQPPQAADGEKLGLPWDYPAAAAAAAMVPSAGAYASAASRSARAASAGPRSGRVSSGGSGSAKGVSNSSRASGSNNSSRQDRGHASEPSPSAGGDTVPAAPVSTSAKVAARPPGCTVSAPSVPTIESLSAAVAAAAVAVAAGKSISGAVGLPGLQLMALAVVAMGMASFANWIQQQQQQPDGQQQEGSIGTPEPASYFTGASQLGGAMMLLFFATIGASSGSLSSLGSSGPLVLFITIMTGVHWLLLGVAGKLLGLPPRLLVLGSNANIGGPATAAGLAQSRGWSDLVQPAMLCGSLGYALGTGAGLLVARLAV